MNSPDYKLVPIDSLLPYARNARTHSADQVNKLAASIQEFGFLNPVIADSDGNIIAGHGRVMAAKQLGLPQIPVIQADHLTPDQQRAYILADNRLALDAGWDEELLRVEFGALTAADFDLSLTGFSIDEITAVMDPEPLEGLVDDDSVPALEDDHVSTPGDVWVLGQHRVMCGDSTCKTDVAKLMNGDQADMVWTDPPYNVAYDAKPTGKIMNDDMGREEFSSFMRSVYARYQEIMKPGAVIYVAHSEAERATFTREFEAGGFKMSQVLIWVKNSGTLSRQDFNWQHEPILFGWKEGAGHYFCKDYKLTTVIDDDVDPSTLRKDQLLALVQRLTESNPTTVIRHDRPSRNELHNTMKPVSLVGRMISWSSRRDETIVDLFGGSGSTLIACHKLGRVCRTMELDPKYADVIVRRWQEFTGEQATHAESGIPFDDIAPREAEEF